MLNPPKLIWRAQFSAQHIHRHNCHSLQSKPCWFVAGSNSFLGLCSERIWTFFCYVPASIYGLTGWAPAGSGLPGQRVSFSWESCLLLQKSDSRKSLLSFIFHFSTFSVFIHSMTHLGQCWTIPWAVSVSSLNEIGCLATFQKMCCLIQHLNALPHTCPILIVSLGLSFRSSFLLGHEINLKCSRYSQSLHMYPSKQGQLREKVTLYSLHAWKKAWQHLSSYLFFQATQERNLNSVVILMWKRSKNGHDIVCALWQLSWSTTPLSLSV